MRGGAVNRSVENLALVWASVTELGADLTDEEWARPTGCPGWTVRDQVAHLVDYESRALGRPGPEQEPVEGVHLKNDLGRANEVGVAARRSLPTAQLLAELRDVTTERLVQLRGLDEAALAAPAMTPAGPGTVADLLTVRVMDGWSHEQDIRRAVQRPGHMDGPAVDEALGYYTRFLPYLVGKRAGAPDGTKVVFRIGARDPVAVEVDAGRARPTTDLTAPTATITAPVGTFAALVGGRTDAPDDTVVEGDVELGRRVVGALGFLP